MLERSIHPCLHPRRIHAQKELRVTLNPKPCSWSEPSPVQCLRIPRTPNRSLHLGSPVVPFYPFSFWVPLLKPNSRKKGALIIKGLLGNLVTLHQNPKDKALNPPSTSETNLDLALKSLCPHRSTITHPSSAYSLRRDSILGLPSSGIPYYRGKATES